MIRHRLTRLAFALTLGAALVPAAPALADAPAVRAQVPGYYRLAVGDMEITALYDGFIDLDSKLLNNASPAEVQRPDPIVMGFHGWILRSVQFAGNQPIRHNTVRVALPASFRNELGAPGNRQIHSSGE